MLSTAQADDAWYTAWRQRELPQLDASGLRYLDYTGAALPAASVVRADAERMLVSLYGNPHSQHTASSASSAALEDAREAVLRFVNADPGEYLVVFTANSSAACRLVGEAWPWERGRPYLLAQDNHNSVVGLREFARARGVETRVLPLDDLLQLSDVSLLAQSSPGLFAFPAQSNFSGVRHPLELVTTAQRHGHAVLLDAAALLHSGALDLRAVSPEFVVLSHYKIAGYPTGVGALIIRRDALSRLRRPWFAGGTVDWVSLAHDAHRLRAGIEGFEDGTPAFLAVGAVPHGLEATRRDGGARLSRHLTALTGALLDGLGALRHPGGEPMVQCYGPGTTRDRGATVACNLLSRDGQVIPHWEVEALASDAGVAIRGGCFCNPGAAERAFAWSGVDVRGVLDRLGADFTVPRFADALPGHAVGALRLSMGLGSVRADVERALTVLEEIACGAVVHHHG